MEVELWKNFLNKPSMYIMNCDKVNSVLLGGIVGCVLTLVTVTFWRRREQRRRNQNRQRPWKSRAKLYHTPTFRSARCTWFIEELGIGSHFDIQPYNPHIASEEEKSWYKSNVSASGKVPALQVGDVTLTESAAICMYLAEAYNDLLPPAGTEHVYFEWVTNAVVVVDPALTILYRQIQRTPESQQQGPLIAEQLEVYAQFAHRLNRLLADNNYICGNTFTVADILVGYNVMWASTIKGGLLLRDYENVRNYLSRLKKRKAFGPAMGSLRDWLNVPQWQPPTEE